MLKYRKALRTAFAPSPAAMIICFLGTLVISPAAIFNPYSKDYLFNIQPSFFIGVLASDMYGARLVGYYAIEGYWSYSNISKE